jgi:hypothetical protein
MDDPYINIFSSLSDPAIRATALSPSDTVDLTRVPKAIYVGSGGDLAMLGVGDGGSTEPTIWKNVPAGAIVPFRARRVFDTDTTAADLLALY